MTNIEEIRLIRLVGRSPALIKMFSWITFPEEVQLEVIFNNSYDLEFVKNPTRQVCLKAIEISPSVIMYIKDPSEEIQLAAINRNPWLIRYVKKPYESVQLLAVSMMPYSIEFIKSPNKKVQLTAIKNCPSELIINVYNLIKKPCKKLTELVNILDVLN